MPKGGYVDCGIKGGFYCIGREKEDVTTRQGGDMDTEEQSHLDGKWG